MTEFFAAIPPDLYDLSLPFVVPGLFPARRIRAELWRDAVDPAQAWTGADLGIGTGSDFSALVPEDSRGKLFGFDDSEGLTRRLTETRRLPGGRHPGVDVEIVLGDLATARERPSAPGAGSCDFVTSSFAIHNMPRLEQADALALVGHLLRPGGFFLYLDLVGYEDPHLERHAHAYDIEFILREMDLPPDNVNADAWRNLQARWIQHYEAENFLVPIRSSASEPDLTTMFERAGLTAPTVLYRLLHTALVVAKRCSP